LNKLKYLVSSSGGDNHLTSFRLHCACKSPLFPFVSPQGHFTHFTSFQVIFNFGSFDGNNTPHLPLSKSHVNKNKNFKPKKWLAALRNIYMHTHVVQIFKNYASTFAEVTSHT